MKIRYLRSFAGLLAFLMAVALIAISGRAAQEYISGKKWHEPKTIDPGAPGGPPSDAIVLFNGKELSAFKGGENWKIEGGTATADKNGIESVQSFGDCQLHLEWAEPTKVEGSGQGRGNSGVYLMGRYEVQILDSYDNATYFDGQCGSIYKQNPPLVNACRKPGEWQSYDIIFRRPRFTDDGKVKEPGAVTVLQNGVLIQNHFILEGSTAWDRAPAYEKHPDKQPLQIQYHGNPVKFRNIWIRELEGK